MARTRKGIKLSPKYGINPSVCNCFFCGQPKGLYLFGKIGKRKEDIEAPKSAIYDYEPCEECKKAWEGKTAIIGCVMEQPEDHRKPIAKADANHPELYPTGSYVVMEKDAITRVFNIQNPGRCMFAEEPVVQDLIKQYEELKKQHQGENNG